MDPHYSPWRFWPQRLADFGHHSSPANRSSPVLTVKHRLRRVVLPVTSVWASAKELELTGD